MFVVLVFVLFLFFVFLRLIVLRFGVLGFWVGFGFGSSCWFGLVCGICWICSFGVFSGLRVFSFVW